MKICNDTLSILKNFASVNSNITFKPGNVLKTLSPSRNIYSEATVAETFESELGIWDLNKFLATVSLFKDPEFDFQESFVKISSASSHASINYYYSDPSLLTPVPKNFKMPESQVELELNTKDLVELQKAASVLQVPDLSLETQEDGGIYLKVFDKRDAGSNRYQIRVGDNKNNLSFVALFKAENLKLIPGHYKIRVSNKNISEFENTTTKVKYWISLEADSKWS